METATTTNAAAAIAAKSSSIIDSGINQPTTVFFFYLIRILESIEMYATERMKVKKSPKLDFSLF